MTLTVFFASQKLAHSTGQADAFTPQNQQIKIVLKTGGFLVVNQATIVMNSGGDDNDGIPKYPKIK